MQGWAARWVEVRRHQPRRRRVAGAGQPEAVDPRPLIAGQPQMQAGQAGDRAGGADQVRAAVGEQLTHRLGVRKGRDMASSRDRPWPKPGRPVAVLGELLGQGDHADGNSTARRESAAGRAARAATSGPPRRARSSRRRHRPPAPRPLRSSSAAQPATGQLGLLARADHLQLQAGLLLDPAR